MAKERQTDGEAEGSTQKEGQSKDVMQNNFKLTMTELKITSLIGFKSKKTKAGLE